MIKIQTKILCLCVAAVVFAACAGKPASDYPLKPVPMTSVKLTDAFWAPRQATDVNVTIGHEIKEVEATGRIRNFELAAAALKGEKGGVFATRYAFDDSDVYKLIEAASYALMLKPDKVLEAKMDEWIAKIAAAQEPDGYLYTARTIDPAKPHHMAGPERWLNLADSHELYNMGHLYEGAVAYFMATGKSNFLDIAMKSADFIAVTFGPGEKQLKLVPGHEEIEMGLVKLYRTTGKKKYLDLAKFFIDQRGNAAGHKLYGEYSQDHKPVLEQTEAVGHSVRAAYLYSGMADVAALTGDASYMAPLNAVWKDIVEKKLYLTGGIGASGGIEGFGPAYDLRNPSGYAETCATIAYALWNWRMSLYYGDAKYMDLFERAVYNAFLSGYGLSGDLFFYPNPLASFGQAERTPWFLCACCPPNVARFIAEMGGFAYAVEKDKVYVNLYVQGSADAATSAGRFALTQTTAYPWNGDVRITVTPEKPGAMTLLVRIPEWAVGKPMPGDLYSYRDGGQAADIVLKVNGEPVPLEIEKGYAKIGRTWAAGDSVDLSLPMPVRRVAARPELKADEGRVAVERGPFVYCAEFADNGGRAANLVLEDGTALAAEARPGLLNGVIVITGEATAYAHKGDRLVGEKQPLTLIPYYAWAHRGRGEMAVWLAREPGKARPAVAPGLSATATVTASEGAQKLRGVNDQYEPESSDDAVGYMHWWPKKGTAEWVEYSFPKPVTVSGTSVYWFDDAGGGSCRVPASWRLFYKSGDQWLPVRTADAFGTAKDAYNEVKFSPVKTTALRLEIQGPADFSAGIQEWKVK
jgi:uncharacterized protein